MNTEGALTIMAYSQALPLNVLEIYSGDEYKSSLFHIQKAFWFYINSYRHTFTENLQSLQIQQGSNRGFRRPLPFSISRRMVLIFSKFILVTSKLF